MSDYDKKARLERDQERKDFLTVINNLRTTFGQAFAAEGAVGHDAASAPPTPSGAGRPTRDRPINVSGLDKMAHDITLLDFDTWGTKWDSFCRVNHVDAYPQNQQTSALGMVLSTKMLQTVEKVLGINSETTLTPVEILTRIHQHLRKKRSLALDRVLFKECKQKPEESFADFYIRLQRVAGSLHSLS